MTEEYNREELKDFLTLKFKEKSFLDALYPELEKMFVNREDIAKLNANQLCDIIIDKNLLEKLLAKTHDLPIERKTPQKTHNHPDSERRLTLDVKVNELTSYTALDGDDKKKAVVISVSFLNTRHKTIQAPMSNIPRFGEAFRFNFGNILKGSRTTLNTLLKLKAPLEFIIYEVDLSSDERTLIAAKPVEWRFILTYRKISLNLEMPSIQNQSISVGVLKVDLFLRDIEDLSLGLLNESTLELQLKREKEMVAMKAKKFFDFGHQWYDEYKSLHPSFGMRAVKIFATDIFG